MLSIPLGQHKWLVTSEVVVFQTIHPCTFVSAFLCALVTRVFHRARPTFLTWELHLQYTATELANSVAQSKQAVTQMWAAAETDWRFTVSWVAQSTWAKEESRAGCNSLPRWFVLTQSIQRLGQANAVCPVLVRLEVLSYSSGFPQTATISDY